ncbi:NADP-dependent oxidoreductase [Amycolatopsis sp. PS_44_ISF1]|uniref:quinone oxidoreductase family protein n=1 Tax=Amycolatopsis sp. PS_44_ISF1 TaxID=2974917 RepID=UPI0028DD72E8|nr:NADP-dependent oxidoreductase [Amycolatopsis sp. PS_44_ISF1]MDT8912312.1 NADP-dependent oxidoreductase [Amycolatopsis sp. PS_44_ISF1]
MKAAQITGFGAPDVIRIAETARPAPGPGEVLVAVEGSSVNGHDVLVRSGRVKVVSGRTFPIGVGLDFAGVVVRTGPGVEDHRVGDRVWGTVHPRRRHTLAGAAEYVVVPADRIAPAPATLSGVEAASLVVGGSTALIALTDIIGLTSRERVLVRGAAGGVGTAAVQLAHSMGAFVTALAADGHATALSELGAGLVLDRSATTPEHIGPFDVIIDTVGTQLPRYRSRLARGGRMATVVLSGPALRAITFSSVHRSRRIRTFSADPRSALLRDLTAHVSAGALRPVIHHVYPLADVATAQNAFERGGVLGKHVIRIAGKAGKQSCAF